MKPRAIKVGDAGLQAETVISIFSTWLQVAALLVGISAALAEETIPREMLLQCEGNSKMFLLGDRKPEVHEDSFKMLLRFRDRMVLNPEVPKVILGKNCGLQNGVIRCELQETLYFAEFNTTEKRHLGVSIVRETGELSQFVETWTFNGSSTAGKPFLNSRVQKTGVCRPAGGPIF